MVAPNHRATKRPIWILVPKRDATWSSMSDWLVVLTPLKNISQFGWLFPIIIWQKNMFQTTNQSSEATIYSPIFLGPPAIHGWFRAQLLTGGSKIRFDQSLIKRLSGFVVLSWPIWLFFYWLEDIYVQHRLTVNEYTSQKDHQKQMKLVYSMFTLLFSENMSPIES